jgi:hypothetical protein
MIKFRFILPLFFFGFLCVIFWPVLKTLLTQRDHSISPPPPFSKSSPTPDSAPIISSLQAILLLHAAPAPLHCSISQNGRSLLRESDAIAIGEYRADVEISRGKDLLVKADWKDGEPHSLRVEVLVQGYQASLEKSFWAEESLEDKLAIPTSFLP